MCGIGGVCGAGETGCAVGVPVAGVPPILKMRVYSPGSELGACGGVGGVGGVAGGAGGGGDAPAAGRTTVGAAELADSGGTAGLGLLTGDGMITVAASSGDADALARPGPRN